MRTDLDTPKSNSGIRSHIQDRIPAFLATLIGGAVAMVVNAPLTSPDDLVGNASSVAFASFVAAIIVAMFWARLSGDLQRRARVLNIFLTVMMFLAVIAAAVIEFAGDISNAIRYIIPLAAIVIVLSSVLTPILERGKSWPPIIWLAIAAPIAMLATGYWLTINEFGFTEAPTLTLPPPPA